MASGRGWMRTLGGLAIRFAPCSSKEAVQSSTASDKVRPVLMTSCSDRYTYRNVSLLASIFCVCTYTKLKRTSHWRQHTITTCACKSMHTYPVAWIMDSAKRASLAPRGARTYAPRGCVRVYSHDVSQHLIIFFIYWEVLPRGYADLFRLISA